MTFLFASPSSAQQERMDACHSSTRLEARFDERKSEFVKHFNTSVA